MYPRPPTIKADGNYLYNDYAVLLHFELEQTPFIHYGAQNEKLNSI